MIQAHIYSKYETYMQTRRSMRISTSYTDFWLSRWHLIITYFSWKSKTVLGFPRWKSCISKDSHNAWNAVYESAYFSIFSNGVSDPTILQLGSVTLAKFLLWKDSWESYRLWLLTPSACHIKCMLSKLPPTIAHSAYYDSDKWFTSMQCRI